MVVICMNEVISIVIIIYKMVANVSYKARKKYVELTETIKCATKIVEKNIVRA